ncbi:MAG: hypothetical protein KF745_13570 [Phycisphaeraceae bacterium]|nr:hypothetical protein [Phycisphaeraceae bacterium]
MPQPRTTSRASSPRRRLIAAMICLASGAFATLATAWGPEVYLAIRASKQPGYRLDQWTGAEQRHVVDDQGMRVGKTRWMPLVEEWRLETLPVLPNLGAPAVNLNAVPTWALRPPPAFRDGFRPLNGIDTATTATGWPCRAARRVTLNGGNDGYFDYESRYQWDLKFLPNSSAYLPLGPIWPGLLAGVCFWSAIIALATFGPGALRRAWRRRRSRCETCGYPLHDLPRGECPECGAPIGLPRVSA